MYKDWCSLAVMYTSVQACGVDIMSLPSVSAAAERRHTSRPLYMYVHVGALGYTVCHIDLDNGLE